MVGTSTGSEAGGGEAAPEVRAELERLLASDAFRNAPQLAAFLTYVVERKLAGRAGDLKGYTIAVEALGRPADFDPQSDPIVRVEAGRLRRALSIYYAEEGANNPVRIMIPVGAYVPTFRTGEEAALREPEPLVPTAGPAIESAEAAPVQTPAEPAVSEARGRPSIPWRGLALLALLLVGGAAVWQGLRERRAPETSRPTAVAHEPAPARRLPADRLAHLPVVAVAVSDTVKDPAIEERVRAFMLQLVDTMARFDDLVTVRELGPAGRNEPGIDYLLEVSVARSDEMIEVLVRLTATRDQRIVWTSSRDQQATQLPDAASIRYEAQRLAVRLVQPFGIIHADLRAAEISPVADCLTLALNMRWRMKTEDHLAARTCLQDILTRDADFSPAWSQLSQLALDEYRSGLNPQVGSPLERALSAALTAVRLSPASARAHQVLMDAQFFRGATDEALAAGKEAILRNPFDPDIMASLGARYVQLDRAAEGLPLLQQAVALSAGRPPWYDFFLFLAATLTGDARLAEAQGALIRTDETTLGMLGKIMVCATQGDEICRSETLRDLIGKEPLLGIDARLYLSRKGFSPSVAERIVAAIGLSSPRER